MSLVSLPPFATTTAPVLENRQVSPDAFLITVRAPFIARSIRAGQFINARTAKDWKPILNRPMSACRTHPNEGTLDLLVKEMGVGSRAMCVARPGDEFIISGPLGNRFALPEPDTEAVLVAGGVGVAPLHMLATELVGNCPRVRVLVGAPTQAKLLCQEELAQAGCEVLPVTEDGSAGYPGLPTLLLAEVLAEGERPKMVYACGPTPMLITVCKIVEATRVACQVSVEVHMACGVGICYGCSLPIAADDGSGYWEFKRACVDGPVFWAHQLLWEKVGRRAGAA